MTGIAHLSTALYLKSRVREAPLPLLLGAAAAPDLLWVLLTIVSRPGRPPLEVARIGEPFRALADLQNVAQPWSHSLVGVAALGLLLALGSFVAFRSRRLAGALFAATVGHFFLDYLVHHADLALWPGTAGLGPAFALDRHQTERGLLGTAPWLAFLLQSTVVAISGVAFLRAFPSDRRGRALFIAGLTLLALLALPLYIGGPGLRWLASMPTFAVATGLELLVLGAIVNGLARRACGRFLPPGPLARSHVEAVTFVRRLFTLAGALAFAAAAVHLAEGMISARTMPATATAATVLALLWAELGRRFVTGNPSTVWGALLLALLLSPLCRVLFPTGQLLLPVMAFEIATALLCLFVARTLLRGDLLL